MKETVYWTHIENKFYPDEELLLDENGEVVLLGDYYHHKINALIKGYIQGYEKGTGKKVELTQVADEHPEFEIQEYE